MIKRTGILILISIMFLVGYNQERIGNLQKQVSDSNSTIESLNEAIKELGKRNKELEELKKKLNDKVIKYDEMESKYQRLTSDFEEVSKELDIALADTHPLEKDYLDEISNWSGVTSDAVEINTRYKQLWEDKINKYYNLIYNALDDDKKYLIVSSQKKWEESIQIDEKLHWQWNDQLYNGGSISYVLNSDASCNIYRDRALALIRIYGIVED
jgi:cell division protein FtsB